jgi:hypothetical protein
MTAKAAARKPANGQPTAEGNDRATALAFEQTVAEEAAQIRGQAVGLDRELFLKLWPLLRRPIPTGYIQSIGAVTGKPYASTGITSVQVQMDRMDNVLTPLGWEVSDDYLEEGKVAIVTVRVLDREGDTLFERSSRGGVDRASTSGNLYKGSFTNAAKLAFARVGPGHEVYVGATDLDPDVHEGAAKAQASASTSQGAGAPPLSADAVQRVLGADRVRARPEGLADPEGRHAPERMAGLLLHPGGSASSREARAARGRVVAAGCDLPEGWASVLV